MKRTIFYTLTALMAYGYSPAQLKLSKGSCPPFTGNTAVFIAGSTDSIKADGRRVKVLDAAILQKGFRLESADSSLKILDYLMVFEDNTGTIHSIPSRGPELTPSFPFYQQLVKARDAGMITLQQIRLLYRGQCYEAEAQVYFLKRN